MRVPFLTLIITAATLVGCETNTQTGALVGAGVGAGAGALISPTPAGILIGAGVGAATGALVGSALDANDRERVPQTAKKIDRGEQLSLKDIEKMSEVGISDDKIIGTIHSTGSVYYLSSEDIQELKDAGVSQRVIDYKLQTAYD